MKGIILFAPEFEPEMAKGIENVPVLLIWAKDDGVVPFSNAEVVLNSFTKIESLFFEKVALGGVSTTDAHKLELLKLEDISMAVSQWIKTLK